jgi:hypothetical protein
MRVDVDPHPLPDSLEGPGALPDRAAVMRDDGFAQLRALDEAAVRAAPADERERCVGRLAPDDSLGSRHSGCPKIPHVLLVVGRPRRDSVWIAKLSSRGRHVPDTYHWVRVLETVFTSDGRSTTVSDYMVDSGAAWRVLSRLEVMSVD